MINSYYMYKGWMYRSFSTCDRYVLKTGLKDIQYHCKLKIFRIEYFTPMKYVSLKSFNIRISFVHQHADVSFSLSSRQSRITTGYN